MHVHLSRNPAAMAVSDPVGHTMERSAAGGARGHPDPSTAPAEAAIMKIALSSPNDNWPMPEDWARIRPLVLAYLRAGRIVLDGSAPSTDGATARRTPFPLGFRTDGTWIWALAVPYGVDRDNVCVDPRLLDHIRGRGFIPPTVSQHDVERARALLATVGRAVARLRTEQPVSV
jgi:hypothetical protein